MPPGVLNNTIEDLYKVDVWMCGLLLVALFTGKMTPFGNITRDDYYAKNEAVKTFQANLNKGHQIELGVSQTAKELVMVLLNTETNKRIDSRTVLPQMGEISLS